MVVVTETRDPEATRRAILDAALTEFNDKGVSATSIADIRRRSGASVGSIYHHFGEKDGIAGALYIDGLVDYQAGFVRVLLNAASTRDGVEQAVHHHIAWIVENRESARFLLLSRDASVVAATASPLRTINREFFGAVLRWARPRIERGELRDLEPDLLTALWIGPSQDLARHWLTGRSRTSLSNAAAVLADSAWRSLSP
jgi:AcrR family transcriptional regulator